MGDRTTSTKQLSTVIPETVLPSSAVIYNADDFYRSLFVDKTWEKTGTLDVKPSSIIEGTSIHFCVDKQYADCFMFLNDMRVSFAVKLVDKEGNEPGTDTVVAPIANFPSALISSVSMYLNETQISSGTSNNYPYWAYTNVLLGESIDKKAHYRSVYGFYEDSDKWWMPDPGKIGWEARRLIFGKYGADGAFKYTKETKCFMADIMTDFSACDLPMVPKVGMRLDLTLNSPSFYLTTLTSKRDASVSKGYQLKIVDATLSIDIRKLTSSLALDLERKMMKGEKLVYRTKRVDIRRLPLHENQTSFTSDALKQSETSPDRMLFFIINSWLVDKPYGISPMYATRDVFKESEASKRFDQRDHAVLDGFRLTINNESLDLCGTAGTIDELGKHHYLALQRVFGANALPSCVALDIDEYLDGKYFIAYDLTASRKAALSGVNVRQVAREGNLKLEAHFSKQLPCNAYLYVLSEYHSAVAVDKNRNVTYHFLD